MSAKPATTPHITLEQWRTLVAVVDEGGYAQAAEALHKSQSSITYAVQRLEHVLNVKVFSIEGRKAILTPVGRMLYQRARQLLEDSFSMERAAGKASSGWESEISLAVEVLFPTWLLLECLNRFGEVSPQTRINLHETILDGGTELLQQGRVDLAILPTIPAGYNGNVLRRAVRFIPVAHPSHPLHQLQRELSLRDLRKHRHIVVRDNSVSRNDKTYTLEVGQGWTVTNMATLIGAVSRGFGFAWLAEDKILHELDAGVLKILPLCDGHERFADLYLILPDSEAVGPGVARLTQIINERTEVACIAHGASAGFR
ncbi:LysR family transcriptional regulator [Natronospirillum operosum]|uniref:LysR family transcriptional regulator n=1 Tax=Natronospirillum operosum TaxID=2759953 RepID=A0A4Z0W987_9GAMM|nr:LysR family transcriptional regulator [Natronospirillum operosum]TGG91717.1 LysR family transcriptional regulator [Natronospirillum operosum]